MGIGMGIGMGMITLTCVELYGGHSSHADSEYFHIIVSVWGAVGRYAAPPDLDSEYFHSAKSN
jgi:hypothetical protein